MIAPRDETPLPLLPPRPAAGHKGTFGSVLVVGGSVSDDSMMVGAPALAALGALRAGAGLARIMMPEPILAAALSNCPSATGVPLRMGSDGPDTPCAIEEFDRQINLASAVVVGPGLGHSAAAGALVIRAVQQESAPLVLDADALNIAATIPELWRDFHAAAVLTPHPGEFRRLGAAYAISADPTDEAQRPACAEQLAQKLGCIVALKGARTVVSDGHRTWVCSRGHVCMATGGTGDVLSGVIAGLAAANRGLSLYDAARLGVEAHARAGERWSREHHASGGMLASELAGWLPAVLEEMRAHG